MTIGELERGAVFRTARTERVPSVWAVKTEYRYPNGQCQCVLLASGEYVHFLEGDETAVDCVLHHDYFANTLQWLGAVRRIEGEQP